MRKLLAEKDGIDPDRIDNEKKLKEKYSILARRSMTSDGYRIYSTIDKKLYDHFKEIAKTIMNIMDIHLLPKVKRYRNW